MNCPFTQQIWPIKGFGQNSETESTFISVPVETDEFWIQN